jgi:hypothetical protein
MVIHSPIFSGSIIQDRVNAFADLSGSFTGSFTGSQIVTGSINLTAGGYLVDGVNVLDSAIAFAIALG